MFDEYLQADKDENDASPALGLQASGKTTSEADAEREPYQRQGERNETDNAHRRQDGRYATIRLRPARRCLWPRPA